jgi:hypothetical protein
MSTDHGFRLPLALRIFLASAVLVAIAVALAAFFTLKQGRRAGADAVEQSLGAANNAQVLLERLSFEKLDVIARTITNDADFVRYVATATDDGLGLGESSTVVPDTSAADAAALPATDVVRPRCGARTRRQRGAKQRRHRIGQGSARSAMQDL